MTLVSSGDINFMTGNIFLNSGRSQSWRSFGPSLLCKNYHILVITFIVGISRSEINSILNPVWQFWATESRDLVCNTNVWSIRDRNAYHGQRCQAVLATKVILRKASKPLQSLSSFAHVGLPPLPGTEAQWGGFTCCGHLGVGDVHFS